MPTLKKNFLYSFNKMVWRKMFNLLKYRFLTILFFVSGLSASPIRQKSINDGSIQMYSQVTHTGNVVFIDKFGEVFYPCR